MYDQDSIDTYGEFKKTITYTDLRSVADAEIRGTNYLAKYSLPFVYTTLKVKGVGSLGLAVGQNIRVVDNISLPAVDSVLLINKHRLRYPGDYDELDVGDKIWRLGNFQADILEKLKRQEESEFSNSEILNNLVNINNASLNPVKVEPRYLKTYTQTASGTNLFILGNTDYGKLDTNKLGDTG